MTLEEKKRKMAAMDYQMLQAIKQFNRFMMIMSFMSKRERMWTVGHAIHAFRVLLVIISGLRNRQINRKIVVSQITGKRKFLPGGVSTGEPMDLKEWIKEGIIDPGEPIINKHQKR